MFEKVNDFVSQFHSDDEGSALESVLMIAVAALIGIGVQKLGGKLLSLGEQTTSDAMTNTSVGY